MPIAIIFFVHYAYLIIFLWVLVEQIGIPIPSIPVLLTAGTLSATHRVSHIYVVLAMLAACLVADTVWFSLGRRYGNSVLKLLCRLSFEASTCVSKTENYFTRRGPVTLLFAKFVPGLSTVAAPIAGQIGMSYPRFLLWDLAGSLIWGETFILAGRFFGDLAKKSAPFFAWLGHFAIVIFVLMVLGFVAHRIWKQRKFLQQVRELRLEPSELKEMLAPHRPQRAQAAQRDHPPRPRRHPLLHLPQRRDLCQASPAAPQDGRLPRPSSTWRLRRLERSWLSTRRLRHRHPNHRSRAEDPSRHPRFSHPTGLTHFPHRLPFFLNVTGLK
jgi:membrane protein DedA with SNARE-associated domain